MLSEFVANLEKFLEMERPFYSEAEGVWTLPADEGVFVTMSSLSPGYRFFTVVGESPSGANLEDFFASMMLANLFGQGTEGGVLGLDEDGLRVTLSMEQTHKVDYKQFEYDLEAFLAALDYWRQQVATAMR